MPPNDLNSPEERKRAVYAAFESGDARFDGQVYVGVSSTGIYCRTVCTAKMPKFENCTFFHTAAEAEAAQPESAGQRNAGRARGAMRLEGEGQSGTITVKLGYHPPYRFSELLAFFRARALQGVELADESSYARTVRIAAPDGADIHGWIRVENDAVKNRLVVTMPDSLAPWVPQVVAPVRRMFDIDCDPAAVASGLAPLNEMVPGAVREGTRLPGCFDPFETACRAVLGQQISVAAAGKLAARIVERYGTPIETGVQGLALAWPTPTEILALAPLEDAFGELGVIKSRSRVIAELARMLAEDELDLGAGALVDEQMQRLLAVKGIGPWTANYIAMRVMSHPDAFLETDAGVAHALPDLTPKQRLAAAENWRPWRSYAVVSLWNALG